MSYEIRKDGGWSCGVGALLKARQVEDVHFVKGYFAHQLEFSEEEIGDQIDGSDVAICSAAGIEELDAQSSLPDIASTIDYCLKNRYMGMCASNGCLDRRTVTELVEEL